MAINTLICTVGTSLFSNLDRLKTKVDKTDDEKLLIKYFDEKNLAELAKTMLRFQPSDRILGAEINTIEESRKKKWLDPERIIFLVSDTENGKIIGAVLKNYFNNRRDIQLEAEYVVVEQLQDKVPADFKKYGLRNLVKELGKLVQLYGNSNVAIDATGGYKAQIAIAVMMGQALNIPVYYKHEQFPEIIDFPPMPVSLDYDLLGHNADWFTDLERGETLEVGNIDNVDPRLRVFITEIEIDGDVAYELNAIGQLYLTSFRLRYPKVVKLVALDDEERKQPTFRDDHYPNVFKEFVRKIYNENKWIKTCFSEPYHGQRAIKGIGFKVRPAENNKYELIGTYKDRDGFGARFQVLLSDQSKESLNWAADQLNQKYR